MLQGPLDYDREAYSGPDGCSHLPQAADLETLASAARDLSDDISQAALSPGLAWKVRDCTLPPVPSILQFIGRRE